MVMNWVYVKTALCFPNQDCDLGKSVFYLLQRQGRPLIHRVVLPLPTELEL